MPAILESKKKGSSALGESTMALCSIRGETHPLQNKREKVWEHQKTKDKPFGESQGENRSVRTTDPWLKRDGGTRRSVPK